MSEMELRKVLLLDAIGSGISTVFTILGAALLGSWLDVSAWVPFGVGLALIPWVWFLVHTVRQDPLRPGEVAVVVAGNVGWAIAAAVLVFALPDAMSTTGRWLVGLFSLAVLGFGLTQWIGLRSLSPGAESAMA